MKCNEGGKEKITELIHRDDVDGRFELRNEGRHEEERLLNRKLIIIM